jgi:hypothetical protein
VVELAQRGSVSAVATGEYVLQHRGEQRGEVRVSIRRNEPSTAWSP